KEWAEIKGISFKDDADLLAKAEVKDKFDREVEKANSEFAQWEKVKKFAILPEEFSVDKGEMTAKLSLRRKIILEHNAAVIDEIYQ
ncbi:MAG: long-chain fatty acid--CoA ligase, partial [Bacteroidota bacterium]